MRYLGCCGLSSSGASAEEYRLQVANLYRDSFAHFIDGPIRTGLGRAGDARSGAARSTRATSTRGASSPIAPLRYGWDELVHGFGAVKVRASVSPGEGRRRWDEAVWEGKPGERSVWVIASSATNHQEVYQVALNGQGDGSTLRYYVPYQRDGQSATGSLWSPTRSCSSASTATAAVSGTGISPDPSRSTEGLAAVIGVNDNPSFADWVYLGGRASRQADHLQGRHRMGAAAVRLTARISRRGRASLAWADEAGQGRS